MIYFNEMCGKSEGNLEVVSVLLCIPNNTDWINEFKIYFWDILFQSCAWDLYFSTKVHDKFLIGNKSLNIFTLKHQESRKVSKNRCTRKQKQIEKDSSNWKVFFGFFLERGWANLWRKAICN